LCKLSKLHVGRPKEHFILGIRTKEIYELSNPIGGELKIDPKGFMLGMETKVCQNDFVPTWHHWHQILLFIAQQNTSYNF
jgi:hypothetical protein